MNYRLRINRFFVMPPQNTPVRHRVDNAKKYIYSRLKKKEFLHFLYPLLSVGFYISE